MKKTQDQIEQIAARAKAEAEPLINLMNEIEKFSMPVAIIRKDGSFSVKWSHEENEAYITARSMVESIYFKAEKEANE